MSLTKIEDRRRVRVLTLCRPEASNAFNDALRSEVNAALAEAAEDDSVGAVVLTGEGKTFSAGIDLKELAALTGGLPGEASSSDNDSEHNDSKQGIDADSDNAQGGKSENAADAETASEAGSERASDEGSGDSWRLLQAFQHFPKPLVMAVNGAAVGLGTTMLGFADLAFASPQARFKCPFTSLGVGAEAASTWLLPQLLGWQNAMWLLLSSEWVGAEEAKEIGLVFKVSETFLEDAVAAATAIAEKDMASAISVKKAAMAWRHSPIGEALSLEGKEFMDLIANRKT